MKHLYLNPPFTLIHSQPPHYKKEHSYQQHLLKNRSMGMVHGKGGQETPKPSCRTEHVLRNLNN